MSAPKILFIVGCPRSGTTWLQKILASHINFFTGQESDFFTSFATPLMKRYYAELDNPSGRGGTGLPTYISEENLYQMLREMFINMIAVAEDYSSESIFIEKTPSHALTIDEINRVFPMAMFIHIIRSPKDVASSMISASKTWGKVWAPSNIWSASKMWKKHVVLAEESLSKIEPSRHISIKYENLKENPSRVLIDIIKHLSLPINTLEVEELINNSKDFKIRLYGEFALRGIHHEIVPDGFIRQPNLSQGRIREINFFEKIFQKIYLSKEIKKFKYD